MSLPPGESGWSGTAVICAGPHAHPCESESQKFADLNISFLRSRTIFPPCKIIYETPVLAVVPLCAVVAFLVL